MSRILLTDNGVTQTHLDFHHGELVIHRQQDVEPILDENVHIRNHLQQSARQDMRLAARVPMIDYQRWRREWRETSVDKWEWQTFLTMKLNSRDYAKFRTEDMRI